MKRIMILVASLLIGTVGEIVANPIPLPTDVVWSLALYSEPTTNLIVWNDDHLIYVLLGTQDRVVLARDSEVVLTSDPFNGEVTALLRADVMGEESPEFLVAVKEDSLNLIHILDGEDFSRLSTITVGWDWIDSYEDPDSSSGESWEEETEVMHWIGGEEGVLIIGKEVNRRNWIGNGGFLRKQGQILRYSILNGTMIDSINSGYDQHWSVVDGDFVVGSSSWDYTWEPVFFSDIPISRLKDFAPISLSNRQKLRKSDTSKIFKIYILH